MNQTCDECGKEYDLTEEGVLYGDDNSCSAFDGLRSLCGGCAKVAGIDRDD